MVRAHSLNRRAFLKAGAAAGAGLAALASPFGARGVALRRYSRWLASRQTDDTAPVTLRFFSAGSAGYQAYFKAVSDEFTKAHPNVTIDYQPQGRDYRTKLLANIAGGDAPDVAAVADDVLRSYAAHGALVDLAPFFQADGLNRNDFWPAAIDPHWLGPHLFGMPYDYGLHVMFYNKALFDAQNLSYPTADWTWDDYIQVGQRLTLDRSGRRANDPDFEPEHVAQYAGDTNLDILGMNNILRSYGGEWASPDLKTAMLDSPTAIQVFQWMADKGTKYFVNSSPKYATSLTFALEQGNVAMHFDGTWSFATYPQFPITKWDQGNIDIVPFLNGPSGRGVGAEASGITMPMGIKDENAKWAWEFIKYITTEPGQRLAFSHGVASIPNSPALAQELIPS